MKIKKAAKNKTRKKEESSMFGKFLKAAAWVLAVVSAVIILFFIYINLPVSPSENKAQIGATFSLRYAEDIGLNWKEAYLAMLDDLQIKNIRIPIYWDLVEKNPGEYDFADIDWQLAEAQKRDAEIILVVGQKVPRWPECFIPEWVGTENNDRQERLLMFEEIVIDRYKNNHPEIKMWQIENEPFLNFGICPAIDPDLLDREISKVKSLDSSRPVMITDSGELSLWVPAAKRADVFGTTMYREVYNAKLGHWRYPIGPNFFKAKQFLIKLFANQDRAVVVELQGEPWVEGWTVHAPLERQLESMNAEILADNVEFAKKAGIHEIYIWGVEWWYWMKTTQNDNSVWEMVKKLNR